MKTYFSLGLLLLWVSAVQAYPPAPASQAQVIAGTEPYLYVTPWTLASALASNVASQAEVNAGVNNNKVVTPATLAAYSGLGNTSALTSAQSSILTTAVTTANRNDTNIVTTLGSPYSQEINPMPAWYYSYAHYGSTMTGADLTNVVGGMLYYQSIVQSLAPFIVCVDDGWQASSRDANGILQMNTNKWPDTPQHYVEYLRNNNMYMMLYTEPTTTTSAGFIGSAGTNITFDAQVMADWGMVGAKFDHSNSNSYDLGGWVSASNYKQFINAFRARSTNGPTYFIVDLPAGEGDIHGLNVPLFNGIFSSTICRTSPELGATAHVNDNGTNSAYLVAMNKWDFDFENFELLRTIRNFGMWTEFDNRYPFPLPVTFANMTAVAGECMGYCALFPISATQAATTSNREFWNVDLDPAHNQLQLVRSYGSKSTFQVYHRELSDHSQAVLLLNRTTNTIYDIPVTWTNVGFSANQLLKVRDVYYRTNVGYFTYGFTNTVGPMSSLLVRISPMIDASDITGAAPIRVAHYELSPVIDTWIDPGQPGWAGTAGESGGPEFSADSLYQSTPATPISRIIRVPTWATSVTGSFGVGVDVAGVLTNQVQMRSFDTGSRVYGTIINPVTSFIANGVTARVPFTYNFGAITNKLLYISVWSNTNGTKHLTGPIILDYQ